MGPTDGSLAVPVLFLWVAGRLAERTAEVDRMSYDLLTQPARTRCRGRVRFRAPGVPGLLLVLAAALLIPRQALAQKMYWIDPTAAKIQRADLNVDTPQDIITSGLTNARFIAIDSAAGKMYWTDLGSDKVRRADLNGDNPEDLTTGLTTPRGIALDVAGGKMYWVDQGTLKIQRKNLDGTGVVDDLVNTGAGSNPRGIALDVAGGKMYWTDQLFDKIQRADLNGDNVEDLVTTGTTNSQGIALDVAGGKMYWTDMDDDTIKRADLNGDNAQTLVSGLNNPFGIALDVSGGKMYWCSQGDTKVKRANLDGTGGVDDLVTTGLTNPCGIALDLGTLVLSDHAAGQETDAFTGSGSNEPAELFAFKLDPGYIPISVTPVVFRLTSIVGLTDGDWTNVDLVVDGNNNGIIDVTPLENTLVGGIGAVDQGLGTVTFPDSFNVSAVTNYILRADFASLSDGDTVTIDLNPADITTKASVPGSTTSVTHTEGGDAWMETGTYTGNAGTSQSITDVGFQPDVVIVKRFGHRKAYIRTSTMPAGMSRMIKKKDPMDADGITSFDAAGFAVGNKPSVNGLNDTYYWIAFKEKTGVCEVSSYTGTPAAQTVPVAFRPDYVIVVPEADQVSVHRSSEVAGDNTFGFEGNNAPFFPDRITALVATGFDVGTAPSVNTNGAVHHYVAFNVSSGNVAVGTYQGDGSVGRAISVGFQPEWVLIHADTPVTYIPDGSVGTVHRPASLSGDFSLNIAWAVNDATAFANCIQALSSTGFEVGSDDTVNKGPPGSGPNYYWMAFADGLGGGGGSSTPKIVRWREVNPN